MALTTTISDPGADSYITLAEFEAYATAQGWTLTGTDPVKEANLRRAAKWIDRHTFAGHRTDNDQALAWPRVTSVLSDGLYAIPYNDIPQRVKDAQAEMAYLINGGADPFATVSGGAVKQTSAQAGPVQTTTVYDKPREVPRFMAVEGLLDIFLGGGAGGMLKVDRG